MPTDARAALVYQFTLEARDATPLVRGWNRLEGRPRSADFTRSLRAEVRDPLWFLTRQWQHGEFEGEDAGSPIDVRLALDTTSLDAFEVGRSDPGALRSVDTARGARRARADTVRPDAPHAAGAGVRTTAGAAKGRRADRRLRRNLYPLDYETGIAGIDTDDARALFEIGQGFLFDTARPCRRSATGRMHAVTRGSAAWPRPRRRTCVRGGRAGQLVLDVPTPNPDAEHASWQPDRLEYRFAVCGSRRQPAAWRPRHRGGDLDWHAFNVRSRPRRPDRTGAVDRALVSADSDSVQRHAEPEVLGDGRRQDRLQPLDVSASDVPKLLIAEFLLLYSNDWCLVPLELPIGSFSRILGLLVTDVFGDQFLVGPADPNNDGGWPPFSMFRLAGDMVDQRGSSSRRR